jgi:hypothetical protein
MRYLLAMGIVKEPLQYGTPQGFLCAGILEQSMGARNRVGIGLSYRPAKLHSLAELIHWNLFLGFRKFKNTISGFCALGSALPVGFQWVPARLLGNSSLFRVACFLPGPEIYKCRLVQASAVLNQLYEGDDGQSSPNLKNEYQLKVH